MTGRSQLLSLLAMALAACVGQAPGGLTSDSPDADVAPPGPDADPTAPDGGGPPDPVALEVSGTVRDYFTAVGVAAAGVSSEGLTPAVTAIADGAGLYALEEVPAASVFYARILLDPTYRPTMSEAITVTDQPVVQDLYVVSKADAQRQHATVGLAVAPDSAMVIADLRKGDGTPREGIPIADVTLTDALGAPVGSRPYFFGSLGDVDPAIVVSTAFGGRARVAFLNVPAGGPYTLTAIYPQDGDGAGGGGGGGGGAGGGMVGQPKTAPVTAIIGGAHLLRIGGQGGSPPPTPGAATFTEDVYPILQKAARGGDGCANCHTIGGVANFLKYDDPPALVHQALLARPGVINVADPPTSLILTKPLYEVPPNHPNATWLGLDNPSYLIVLSWIQGGAPL